MVTARELIRLKKEVFLLQHGFYDKEVLTWLYVEGHKKEVEKEYGTSLTFDDYYKEILRNAWFRNCFPEFFEKDLKK